MFLPIQQSLITASYHRVAHTLISFTAALYLVIFVFVAALGTFIFFGISPFTRNSPLPPTRIILGSPPGTTYIRFLLHEVEALVGLICGKDRKRKTQTTDKVWRVFTKKSGGRRDGRPEDGGTSNYRKSRYPEKKIQQPQNPCHEETKRRVATEDEGTSNHRQPNSQKIPAATEPISRNPRPRNQSYRQRQNPRKESVPRAGGGKGGWGGHTPTETRVSSNPREKLESSTYQHIRRYSSYTNPSKMAPEEKSMRGIGRQISQGVGYVKLYVWGKDQVFPFPPYPSLHFPPSSFQHVFYNLIIIHAKISPKPNPYNFQSLPRFLLHH